jgi:hypothetical protein
MDERVLADLTAKYHEPRPRPHAPAGEVPGAIWMIQLALSVAGTAALEAGRKGVAPRMRAARTHEARDELLEVAARAVLAVEAIDHAERVARIAPVAPGTRRRA